MGGAPIALLSAVLGFAAAWLLGAWTVIREARLRIAALERAEAARVLREELEAEERRRGYRRSASYPPQLH